MLRDSLRKRSARPFVFAFLAIAIIIACFSIYVSISPGDTREAAGSEMFVDAKTGKAFSYTLKIGEKIPVYSPSSGEAVGFPAVACYWNANGTIRATPYWVLLNETIGKKGPTFCPDCGRLVTGPSAVPKPGDRPPPTKAEYEANGAARSSE